MRESTILKRYTAGSKKTHPARGCTAAHICINCVYTIPAPRDWGPIPFFGQAARPLPATWLALLLTNNNNDNSDYNLNNNNISTIFTQHPYCCVNNIVLTLFLNESKFDVRIHSLNLFHSRGTSSQILARRHTETNTPVIWICDS